MARPRLTFALLMCAGLTYSLSQTLIIPALPAITAQTDATPAGASWLMTGYLLAASVATPLVGKLGDLYGRGKMLTWVMAIFIAGSITCALGSSLPVLIGGRVLQGIAGGVFPLAYGVIRDTFPPGQMMAAIGTLSVSLGAGSALGPPISGIAVEQFGPESIFWIALIGAVPCLLGYWLIRDRPVAHSRRLDIPGAVMLAALLMCLLLALTQGNRWGWTSPAIVFLLAGFCTLLYAWVRVERSRPDPLIDLGLLRSRPLAMVNLTAVFSGIGIFASYIPLAAFVQAPLSSGYGFALSAGVTGLLLMPHGIAIVLLSRPVGKLCRRVGPRPVIVVGATVNAVACAQLVAFHDTAIMVCVGSTVLGVGQALLLAGMANLVVAEVPQGVVGIATGMNTIMRTIGQAFGSAASGAVLIASFSAVAGLAGEDGYVGTFALAAIASAAAVGTALALPRPQREPTGLVPLVP